MQNSPLSITQRQASEWLKIGILGYVLLQCLPIIRVTFFYKFMECLPELVVGRNIRSNDLQLLFTHPTPTHNA